MSALHARFVGCFAIASLCIALAPDGFAHPVFRAGFALAIPLPEVS